MRLNLWLLTALGLASVLAAGPASDPVTDGKHVIDQAVEALGGDRFLNFHNRSASGRLYSFFRGELSAFDRAHIYTDYPQAGSGDGLGIRERELFGKKQDYSYLYLPSRGYELTFRGARVLEDEVWTRYRRTTENDIFYILKVRHGEAGMTFDYVGSQVYLSRHVEIVDITDARGNVVRVYFDHNSHFPVRQSFTWVDETTRQRDDEITDYDKFRDIGGGIYWPFTIERSRNGYKVFQVFAEAGEANVEPPPRTFELPPGAKMLAK